MRRTRSRPSTAADPHSGHGGRRIDDANVAEYRMTQDRILERYRVDAESRFVEIPSLDGRAHVLVTGHGPPVVMVIGGGMVAGMWAPLMAQMNGFTLYAVDLPGHGMSDPVTYRTNTLRPSAVTFLSQLLDGLALDGPFFVAQSMGGLFSSWFALECPDRVAALSLIGCPAFLLGTSAPLPLRLSTIRPLRRLIERLQPPSPKQVNRLAAMAGEDLTNLPELRDLFVAYEKLPGAADQLLALHRAGVGVRGSWPQVRLDATELAVFAQPVQFIWGNHDPFGPPDVGRQAAEIIPDARFHCVEAGHGPWFSRAEEVGLLVTDFLHQQAKTRTKAPTPGGIR